MAKSVVGLFDDRNHAQMAMRDLESAGLSNSATFVDNASSNFSSMLTNAGIPQQDATIYAEGVQQGGSLIMLQALNDRDAETAADILDRHHVVDISQRMRGFQRQSLERTSTTTTARGTAMNSNLYNGQDIAIPIIEEELRVGKREVEGGGVRVNTRVEEVPVNEQVTLRDEEIDVHRKRVDRPVTEADMAALQTGTFEVREHDEEAIVDKTARVVEEVHVKKDVQERTETIQDTVRRTDVDVDQLGQRSVGTTDVDYTNRDVNTTGGSLNVNSSTDEVIDRETDRNRRDNY
jgi:uncharacterized protein (TIGR02271 family)